MTFELIALSEIATVPWKNGAGLTRELAISPADASVDDFDWRISVAAIERDAPFSAFPGVDRCIVLLRGAGMRLRSVDGAIDRRLTQAYAPHRFSGDAALQASLIDGTCEDLNVMVRRGCCVADVATQSVSADVAAADAGLLLCASGEWQVGDVALKTLHALLWRSGLPRLQAHPLRAASALIVVRLCQDHA